MKILVFSFLICMTVLFVDFLPTMTTGKNRTFKTDKEWVDEILKEQGLERMENKDYIFKKWKSKTHEGCYDFNLDIVDKEIKNE